MNDSNPIDMLRKDHRRVEGLFSDFSHTDMNDHGKKRSIADDICTQLKTYMKQEEDVFYPAVENFSEEGKRLVADGKREHQEMKNHIARIENAADDHATYDTVMKDLESVTKHHVQEEEANVFPFAERNISDRMDIGMSAKMMKIKAGDLVKEKVT